MVLYHMSDAIITVTKILLSAFLNKTLPAFLLCILIKNIHDCYFIIKCAVLQISLFFVVWLFVCMCVCAFARACVCMYECLNMSSFIPV